MCSYCGSFSAKSPWSRRRRFSPSNASGALSLYARRPSGVAISDCTINSACAASIFCSGTLSPSPGVLMKPLLFAPANPPGAAGLLSRRWRLGENPPAMTAGSASSESRRVVTILFSDIRGSTGLGEELDPEALQDLLSRFFAEMKRVVERHEGLVEKFIGDAVMAVFGLPRVHEGDARRAVRAAARMRRGRALLHR